VKPRRSKPRPLSALVTGVLEDLGLNDATAILRISDCWEAAVGTEVAQHCQPRAMRGRVLEATVDSSVWCHQLQLRKADLLAALARELGDQAPADLRLHVG